MKEELYQLLCDIIAWGKVDVEKFVYGREDLISRAKKLKEEEDMARVQAEALSKMPPLPGP